MTFTFGEGIVTGVAAANLLGVFTFLPRLVTSFYEAPSSYSIKFIDFLVFDILTGICVLPFFIADTPIKERGPGFISLPISFTINLLGIYVICKKINPDF